MPRNELCARCRIRPKNRANRSNPSYCDVCVNARQRDYIDALKEDPEAYRTRLLHRRLAKYDFTVEQFWAMWEEQGGKCRLCHEPLVFETCCIDHSHRTSVVRGILCRPCNLDLGVVEGRPREWLEEAERYLG